MCAEFAMSRSCNVSAGHMCTRVISVMKALHELAAIKYVYLDTCSYRGPYPAAVAMQYVLYERVRDAVYH